MFRPSILTIQHTIKYI